MERLLEVGGATPAGVVVFRDTYVDTPNADLMAHDAWLRWRDSKGDTTGRWELKINARRAGRGDGSDAKPATAQYIEVTAADEIVAALATIPLDAHAANHGTAAATPSPRGTGDADAGTVALLGWLERRKFEASAVIETRRASYTARCPRCPTLGVAPDQLGTMATADDVLRVDLDRGWFIEAMVGTPVAAARTRYTTAAPPFLAPTPRELRALSLFPIVSLSPDLSLQDPSCIITGFVCVCAILVLSSQMSTYCHEPPVPSTCCHEPPVPSTPALWTTPHFCLFPPGSVVVHVAYVVLRHSPGL